MRDKSTRSAAMVPVLYEDALAVCFLKPAGLLVIPSPREEKQTLIQIVNQEKERITAGGAKLHPCHRLDRDTSGVILFAKGKKAQKTLMDLFRAQLIQKTYMAFVHGRMKNRAGVFQQRIKDLDARKYQPRQANKQARTRYRVREVRNGYSVVEAEPVTGRTNQIRIHFAQAGHPLLGERKYAFARDYDLKFRRTALHAARLSWLHPVSGNRIVVEAPLAKDMESFLSKK